MPFKHLFPDSFRVAIMSGKPVEYEIDGEAGTFVLDRTHGECVCKLTGGEETPLFHIRYLNARYRPGGWVSD